MRIPFRKYDIIVEILCIICLLGTFVYLAIAWGNIPKEVPGHYNAMGEVDRVTGKNSLLVLPFINAVMYLGMSVIELFPQLWNTGVTVTEENKYRVYRNIKDMMKTTKLIMVLVFTYLTINSALAIPLPAWFTPVSLFLIMGSLVFFIVRLVKNK